MTPTTPPLGGDTTAAPAVPDAADRVMDLLHEHVPLSLLVDLAEPGLPDSRALLEQEGAAEGGWWEPEAL